MSTLFCCLPLGIVAIIHAAKVDGLYRSGDYSGAQEAADNAKKYAQYGLIVGLIVGVIYFFIGMAGSMLFLGDYYPKKLENDNRELNRLYYGY